MIRLISAVVLVGSSIGVMAQSADSFKQAAALGNILAAEAYCGLSYDQQAISVWIDENTDPGDMGFASTLSMMTDGAQFDLKSQSESQKTAHCRSVERTAKHLGFIK